ncbi:MAG: SDR family NAD(P)-dependent oxidoreductase [Chloroflexota bacterium]
MKERVSIPPDRPLEPQRRAIVVGASSGIGKALVRELVSRGYRVAAVARRQERLAELCHTLNAQRPDTPCALAYPHDVTHFEEIPGLFQTIANDLGGLEVILYVAGVLHPVAAQEYDFDKEASMIQVNLLGAMAWLGQAAVRFERAGSGHIVGISSVAGDRGRRANPAYHASKAGLTTYLESLRNRLTHRGVRVTTIKPGFVDTDMLRQSGRTRGAITATAAARQIVQAMERGRQTVYVPGRWALIMLILRHIPSFLFRRLNI